jgi:hypothetical protein
MSATSRTKGQSGERELAGLIRDITGWNAQRRVRQHDGDSDIEGIPGWTVEVKRHKAAARGDIASWWRQATVQASKTGGLPVLFFRRDRDTWRAVWPAAVQLGVQSADMWSGYGWTVEGSIETWAAVAREVVSA